MVLERSGRVCPVECMFQKNVAELGESGVGNSLPIRLE
jgi:hypothetical protein